MTATNRLAYHASWWDHMAEVPVKSFDAFLVRLAVWDATGYAYDEPDDVGVTDVTGEADSDA
ncbi:MAG: hypothetical protein HYX62_01130 [Gammaproteobacteria bacterium]|nr:hypothetical protein [Gammaproteobacteria bacterium]